MYHKEGLCIEVQGGEAIHCWGLRKFTLRKSSSINSTPLPGMGQFSSMNGSPLKPSLRNILPSVPTNIASIGKLGSKALARS